MLLLTGWLNGGAAQVQTICDATTTMGTKANNRTTGRTYLRQFTDKWIDTWRSQGGVLSLWLQFYYYCASAVDFGGLFEHVVHRSTKEGKDNDDGTPTPINTICFITHSKSDVLTY